MRQWIPLSSNQAKIVKPDSLLLTADPLACTRERNSVIYGFSSRAEKFPDFCQSPAQDFAAVELAGVV
jgi:hypothetical protein